MQHFQKAIEMALNNEVSWTRDPQTDASNWGVHHDDPPPWNRMFGPIHSRGPVSGVIWKDGIELARWGEPERADLTFSVAKTYLGLLAGIAHGRGLIKDLHETVFSTLPNIGFDSPHNRKITWHHLLTQTSEWEGVCFGIPDTVDRYRQVHHDPKPIKGKKGDSRPLNPPGTYWEYNDVRINQLSLALLHLFGEPLLDIFLNEILTPLGGGEDFKWIAYDQAWVTLFSDRDNSAKKIASVPGGTHWGGGVSITAMDQCRIGELMLNKGYDVKSEKMLLPIGWVEAMREPCDIAPFYGRLLWLNTDCRYFPSVNAESFFMVGAGGNYVWIDPIHKLTLVVRWINPNKFQEFTRLITQSL